jgi:hypothetical protein
MGLQCLNLLNLLKLVTNLPKIVDFFVLVCYKLSHYIWGYLHRWNGLGGGG